MLFRLISSKYLRAVLNAEASEGKKTHVWDILARRDGFLLGQVRWFGRWRQYTFYPSNATIFNPDCLMEIADFCARNTRTHRINQATLKKLDDARWEEQTRVSEIDSD